MFDVFGRIFGTTKAINDLTDKDNGLLVRAGGWIDDFSYTDAEKAQADVDRREWGIRQLEALQPFKVVQRILALSISTLWAIVAINVLVGIWVEALSDYVVVEPLLEFALSDYMVYPTMACFTLYFGGGTINSLKKKAN